MEVRSYRRVRTLVTQMARSGLSANEIAPALIPMMARSETLQSKAGYIDARPLPPLDEILLRRTAGPYIGSKADFAALSGNVRFTPNSDMRSGHPEIDAQRISNQNAPQ
jgi:hypothetical protein